MNKTVKSNLGNQEVFSRNLRRYLETSGKKQIEVARFVGVSRGTVSDWTNGRLYPRMDKIQLLADFFEIQKADLVEDDYVPQQPISDEDKRVLDLFHQVKEEKREFVLSMIQATIDNQ